MATNQVFTIKGYDLFEVVSAFQKSIRRCDEHQAMYWGVELFESGFIPYAWKRMVIIAMEDIGLADPMAPVIVKNLKEIYEDMTKNDKKGQYRLPYVQAILYLVNAPKSRHTDWALNYWFDTHLFNDVRYEIPEYALDIHTRRGKAKGKTITDFFTEGSVVNNHVVLGNELFYREECQKRWENKRWCELANAEKERRKNGVQIPKQERETPVQQGDLFGGV